MTSRSLTSLTNENQPRLNVALRVGIVFTLATLIWLLICVELTFPVEL